MVGMVPFMKGLRPPSRYIIRAVWKNDACQTNRHHHHHPPLKEGSPSYMYDHHHHKLNNAPPPPPPPLFALQNSVLLILSLPALTCSWPQVWYLTAEAGLRAMPLKAPARLPARNAASGPDPK
jgi:hypothetical protein